MLLVYYFAKDIIKFIFAIEKGIFRTLTKFISFLFFLRSLRESLFAVSRQKNKKEEDDGEEEYSLSCLQ